MTVKSNFKLDDRIKSIDDVQTCLHYDDSYIGKTGYFASDLCDLSNLSGCLHDTLAQIILDGAGDDIFRTPHDAENGDWGSRFFIPESLLRPVEKKYRPYSLAEWIDQHEIGEVIHYRSKSGEIELRQMYVGTRHSQGIKNIIVKITLGNESHTLDYLLEDYEIEVNGEWLPFGVLDNGEKE